MGIKLTCNYVSEVRELIQDEQVELDYVKFPAINDDMTKLDEAIKIRPVMFHGFPPYYYFMCLGSNEFKELPVEELNNVIKKTGTPHVSGHIKAIKSHYPDFDGTEKYKNKILNVTVDNIAFVMDKTAVPFLAENHCKTDKLNDLTFCYEPEFISNVVKESGCKFLFDITHAMISAEVLNMKFSDYMAKLPMDQTHEIHLSGSKVYNGHLIDVHGKLDDKYYEILDYLLQNTPAKYVTLEYMTQNYDKVDPHHKNNLYEQLVRLKEIISKY